MPLHPDVGKRFGNFVIIKRLPSKKTGATNTRVRVLCQCDCGSRIIVPRYYLVREPNPKTHCGCKNITPGIKFSPEYGIWSMMLKRCYDEKHVGYKDYGGRGIRVCARWIMSFDNFLEDMGPRPNPRLTLDRKDPDGNYEPDNCRWATAKEQAWNKRRK